MLFNSGDFFFFFLVVYVLYVSIPHRAQNILLLAASYFFYGYWDWRFLILIFISTVVDYFSGISIKSARDSLNQTLAKRWLILSLMVNLGILGFFKYFNFFADSFSSFMSLFGWEVSITTLNIILPVGISFYTFQTMSYSIDVFRGHTKPTKHFADFALFVSFFPQLMAGPIERFKKLFPQIQNKRSITYNHLTEGGWLILWGVFKKVFIADNMSPYTFWSVYSLESPNAGDLYVGCIAFVFQMYCDFSGYSDMARGLASLLGFKLSINFNLPYFTTNPSKFWQKWHITLGYWLRDYCYGPLAKAIKNKHNKKLALIITFALAGLWHGADLRFIFWGIAWSIAVSTHIICQPLLSIIKKEGGKFKNLLGILGWIYTMHFWIFTGIIFVSANLTNVWEAYTILFTDFTYSDNTFKDFLTVIYFGWPLIFVQFAQYLSKDLDIIRKWPIPVKFSFYIILLFLLLVSGAEGGAEFIYFQF
ncbi:MAG: membrane-bound O-acyltransferase family protein [Candidatus Marinimicrobia bacterium]|nr:membrane-bound O-acyltransferase family protein [Candidatus Neomarinimicrobiota bacterium]|tara:strand:+ start:958 stop:2388 length:1431 start_codon:yes stop_codon:yes gene_type:complete